MVWWIVSKGCIKLCFINLSLVPATLWKASPARCSVLQIYHAKNWMMIPEAWFSMLLCSEIDKNIDHMTNLRKDKWAVEGKLRKWVHASSKLIPEGSVQSFKNIFVNKFIFIFFPLYVSRSKTEEHPHQEDRQERQQCGRRWQPHLCHPHCQKQMQEERRRQWGRGGRWWRQRGPSWWWWRGGRRFRGKEREESRDMWGGGQ